MRIRKSIRTILLYTLKTGVLLFLGLLLYRQFGDLNFQLVRQLLAGMGAAGVLIVLPYGLVIALDAAGWKGCINTGSRRLPLIDLTAIRLATDAVMNTIPAGVALAETLRPLLLQRRFDLRMGNAIASTMMAKINMAVMQMVFVMLAVLLLTLQEGPLTELGWLASREGEVLLLASALLFLTVLLLPYFGVRLQRIATLLQNIRVAFIQRFLVRLRSALGEIDTEIAAFVRGPKTRVLKVLSLFLLSWLMMAAETWLIFSLLGAELSVAQAVILEGLLSAIKLIFFFIPSGLGAQEVGIPGILAVFGVHDVATVAAAFILLRRGKELGWSLTGLSVFGVMRINPFRPALQRN